MSSNARSQDLHTHKSNLCCHIYVSISHSWGAARAHVWNAPAGFELRWFRAPCLQRRLRPGQSSPVKEAITQVYRQHKDCAPGKASCKHRGHTSSNVQKLWTQKGRAQIRCSLMHLWTISRWRWIQEYVPANLALSKYIIWSMSHPVPTLSLWKMMSNSHTFSKHLSSASTKTYVNHSDGEWILP